VSVGALLGTLVLLFGFQSDQIIAQPMVIALLAVPILVQVYLNAGLAFVLNRLSGEAHCVAGPSALIGVLVEVPVMLSVMRIVNSSKGWYEAGRVPANG
jgi:ACR3 family arsenite transporter